MAAPLPTRSFRETASNLPLGFIVVALYVLFVGLVFSGFASYIYRGEWQATFEPIPAAQGMTVPGEENAVGVADIDSLIFVLRRTASIRERMAADLATLETLEAQAVGFDAAYRSALGGVSRLAAEVLSQSREDIRVLSALAQLDDSAPQARLKNLRLSSDKPLEKIAQAIDIVQYLEPPISMDPLLKARFDAAKQTHAEKAEGFKAALARYNNEAHGYSAELENVNVRIDRLKVAQASNQKLIEALENRVSLGSPHQARFEALSVQLPFGFRTDLFKGLVSFPTIFLTLIVTIAAGGLGTVVAFSRRYYREDSKGLTMSRLFVNVGEGIAAAIAIFLFSGAGMLALTQGGGAMSDVELSPYTVAFVAFLSGFMAEDAFAAIQAAGKRIFSGGNGNGNGNGQPPQVVDTSEKPMPVLDPSNGVVVTP